MKARLIPNTAYALAVLLIGAGVETSFAQTSPRIAPTVIERIASEGRARVLVELAAPNVTPSVGRPSAAQVRQRRAEIAAQRERLQSVLGDGDHRVLHEFADEPYVALDIDASTLAKLESASSVAIRVLEDKLLAPTLAESVPRIEADRAHAVGLNGAGTVVAVIDSGVDLTHPFFADRLIEDAEACYATAESGPGGDCPNGQATQIGPGAAANCTFAPLACGHGTHVAGIAVGAGTEFSGVAPAAGLIAIQVFHPSTDCVILFEEYPCPRAFESDIVAGLEYVYGLRDQYNIAAVNMSLGGTAYDSACDAESPLFAAAIDNLKSVGIATVVASGNDALTYGISEPACIASAISVGATNDYDDEVAWYTNSSADLDLLAPGSLIYSSVPGGGYEELEGTSMAAPHVAGAWAVYKQAYPAATVDEALASFIDTGVAIVDWRGGPTKPRIRVGAAVGVESPAPVLSSISPTQVVRYGPGFTLTVDGSGFVSSSQVLVNGVAQATTYVSETRLTANVASDAIATTGAAVTVTVFTPAPGGGTTDAATINLLTSSVEVDRTAVTTGGIMNVTAVNPPGWSGDWLTLASVGSPASSFIDYVYVATNPTWSVQMPQTPGDYEFRLLVNNSYTAVAVSPTISVEEGVPGPDPQPPTLTPSTASAAPGEAVTVTVEGSPGGATDWLALAQVGAPATSYFAYVYVGVGVTDRTWTVNMPQATGEYEFRLFANNGYTQMAASPPVTVSEVAPEPDPGATTLTPSTTSAAPGEAVTVTVADAPGGATDWLALAQVGAAANNFVAYVYVGDGITDRTWTVNMPQTLGQYEFRLFANNGYTQIAVSAPVTVAEPEPDYGSTTLTPSTTSAAPGEAVTVTLAAAPGGATDWLALAQVGAAANNYVTYVYVGAGVTDRTWTVNMPQTLGDYEFRLFSNNSYTQVAVSPPVSVEEPAPNPGPATLTPSTTSAAPGEAVTVTVADAPGGAGDWLALASVGSSATNYLTYIYVGAGVTDRTWTVNMPQTLGEYEFRLFVDNSYTQVAVSPPISVEEPVPEPGNPTLTPSTTSAAPGEAVTVSLADAPGGATDWLALAQVGAAPNNYVAYIYVGSGVTERTWTVNMPQTLGDYEFRLFANNGYTQIAVSAPVTVAEPEPEPAPDPGLTTLTPSTTSTVPGSPVTVTLANAPGGAGDWLALASVGSPTTTYITYTYVGNNVTDRTWTVIMPQTPGTYEFRLFLNYGYTQLAVSPPVVLE